MTIAQVSAKIDLRLNKGASSDYDNLWSYQKQEAFNKAVTDWVRRQYRGRNITQEGDEETITVTDDLQTLLKSDGITIRDKGLFVQTNKLPSDYLYYKRVDVYASSGNCTGVRIESQLEEEANVNKLLSVVPSFKFEETFHTLINNKIHVYHNKDFTIDKVEITYYRKPKVYNFKKLSDTIEFKDDVADIIVDEACKIIASDIESLNQKALADERIEKR